MKYFEMAISFFYYDKVKAWAKDHETSVVGAIRFMIIQFFKDKPY